MSSMETTLRKDRALRRSLSLRDLIFLQIILTFNFAWTGFAARQGPTHVALWLAAVLLFYIPLIVTVSDLSRDMPLEGGVYQWAKLCLSPFAGFIAGWSMLIYAIAGFASVGPVIANGIADAVGWRAAWLTGKSGTCVVLLLSCCAAYWFNVHGLPVIKRLGNAGSVATFALFGVIFYLLVRAWMRDGGAAHRSFSMALPPASIGTLNILSKLCVCGFSGFDSSAVFSGECRKPAKDLAVSGIAAAPLIALMYILGTAAVLAYVPAENVDLAATVAQLFAAGFGHTALGSILAFATANIFNLVFLASFFVSVGMLARLPMVAGWDNLLPPWWSSLHPKFHTPVKAITAIVLLILLFGLLNAASGNNQDAVQLCVSINQASLSVMYMILFAINLVGMRKPAYRPGLGTRLSGLSGCLVGASGFLLAFKPLGESLQGREYPVKVAAILLVVYLVGFLVYRNGARTRQTHTGEWSAAGDRDAV